METRKVQLSGGTTYTVSLPKQWAMEHGIESGSVLSLHPNEDGSLLIDTATNRRSVERSVRVDVSTDSEGAIRQRVRALHAVGADTVTLTDPSGHPPERRTLIEETLRELSGFELLETSDTRIRITNLIDAENVDVRKSVLRLRLVMLAMHRDAVAAVVDDDEELARRVVSRDEEADKLFAMVTRHFRRSLSDLTEVEKLSYSRDELFEHYYAARQFERIADHAVKMAEFVREPNATIPADCDDDLSTLGRETRELVDAAADSLLSDGGIEAVADVLGRRDDLFERLDRLDRELYGHDAPNEAYTLGIVLDSLRRCAQYGVNVASIAVQQLMREQLDTKL